MRRRLVVTDARPSPTGASDWRRAAVVAGFHDDQGAEVTALCLHEGRQKLGGRHSTYLRRIAARPAFAARDEAANAVAALHRRFAFDVVHLCGDFEIASNMAGAVLIREGCDGTAEESAAPGGPDIAIRLGHDQAEPRDGLSALLLRQAYRYTRPRIAADRVLAGCWVEDEPRAIDAARGLFEAILRKGGGYAPNFVLAGPGAARVKAPRLPVPVTVLDTDTAERVFYRGLDLALFPDAAEAGASRLPRYDALDALELGATPLVSESALAGISHLWRLPRFSSLDALAEYLLENGRALSEGGMMAELRARADWTWSGLAEATGRHRGALMQAIEAALARGRE